MATTRLAAKRRKTAPVDGHGGGGGGDGVFRILDLPEAALAKVGEFVPKTSAALLAVALTAPPSSWRQGGLKGRPSAAGVAVLSSISCRDDGNDGWEVIDFEDVHRNVKSQQRNHDGSNIASKTKREEVETSLANKLDDDDISALLICLDAVNKVKRLKLAGCTNISGQGLEPLRGSSVVEQIDLCLAEEHTRPTNTPSPKISVAKVIPILRSIIRAEGSALKHLQFPEKWAEKRSPMLETLINEFSDILDHREIDCSHCQRVHLRNADGLNHPPWFSAPHSRCVLQEFLPIRQSFTCYKCLKSNCQFDERGDRCRDCRKYYCDGCMPEKVRCPGCEELYCIKCTTYMDCEVCNLPDETHWCYSCYFNTFEFRSCHKCEMTEERKCSGCSDIKLCEWCHKKSFCPDCIATCSHCGHLGCGDDCGNCEGRVIRCENESCKNEGNCGSCSRDKYAVCKCKDCQRQYCLECRQEKKEESAKGSFCSGCTDILRKRSRKGYQSLRERRRASYGL
ncbi:hypothetical protein ACHAWF_017093 [Thalassiosira exigua]